MDLDHSHPEQPDEATEWLVGGGAMGALMRTIDWSATPLGPMASWPQSLRTSVSTCLNSRFPILLWWGREMVMLYNDAYAPITGIKHPRSMGQRGRECWPEIWDIIGPMLDGVFARGEATWSEDQMLPLERSGFVEECYFTFSYSPIRDESGGIGGIFTAVTETTSKVLGERRLSLLGALAGRASRAMTTEQACTLAIEALADAPADVPFAAIYVTAPDGRSARLVGACGLSEDSPLRVATLDLSVPLPDQLASAHGTALMLPLIRPGREQPDGFLVAGVSPRLELDARYAGFLHLAADHVATAIANARIHEDERLQAEKLAGIDRAKTAFFSNVSHEFRTPLTLILGPVEDALGLPTPALRGDGLRAVHRNGLRLLKLVNTLLDFSRIEAGRMQAAFEPTDLVVYTADLASTFRAAVEQAGLTLEVTATPLPDGVYVDPGLWEKIVLNLLSNAFKFTFEGGITVSLRPVKDRVELSVRDTGTGIPPSELPRLFERFHRIEGARARSHEGSGIGLALVSELVKMHGGSIAVASTVGRGSEFTVSIPTGTAHLPAGQVRARRDSHPAETRTALYTHEAEAWLRSGAGPGSPSDTPVPAPTTGVRILLADDNADMREYVERLLEGRFTVEAVADGEAALASARARPPTLVLTDVMMPGLDGLGLLRALRADPRTRSVPVVFLSARAGEDSRIEGIEAGADDYLVKPFSARELLARVNTHVELSRARVAAESRRASLQSLFMQAPVAVAVLRGPDHVFDLINPLYRRILGRRDMLGRSVRAAMPELAGQGFYELLDQVFASGVPFSAREMPAQIDIDGDGVLVESLFDFVYQPMLAEDGRVEAIMACAFDVTEQSLARRRVEEANRAKDEFLATVSHELRTPLTAILGWSRMLLQGTVSEEKRPKAIETIERNARMQVQLIEDLLDYSRIIAGKLRLNMVTVDLAQVVELAVESARPAANAKGLTLEAFLGPPGPAFGRAHGAVQVHGDPDRLQQVVWNLLTNAVKFTPSGGTVKVSLASRERSVQIMVEDTGQGITPEFLPHVFERFRQAESGKSRTHGGLGLGLAIVKHLVELHAGDIGVHSEGHGRGTTFVVNLQALSPLPPTGSLSAERVPGPSLLAGRGLPSLADVYILVVDDELDTRELVREILKQAGAQVALAASVNEAWTAMSHTAFDAVVCDVGMPGESGYDLVRRVRALPTGQMGRLPMVALTAYAHSHDRTEALRAGFNSHVVKPVEPQELVVVLASLLGSLPP